MQKKENSTRRTKYENATGERFRFSPQAPWNLLRDSGVSSRVMIEVPDCDCWSWRIITWHQRLPGMDLAVFVQGGSRQSTGTTL